MALRVVGERLETVKKIRNCVSFVNGSGAQEGVDETQQAIDDLLADRDELFRALNALEEFRVELYGRYVEACRSADMLSFYNKPISGPFTSSELDAVNNANIIFGEHRGVTKAITKLKTAYFGS